MDYVYGNTTISRESIEAEIAEAEKSSMSKVKLLILERKIR